MRTKKSTSKNAKQDVQKSRFQSPHMNGSASGINDFEFHQQSDSIWALVQESIFNFYNNLLEVQVFTPLLYSFLVMLSLIQQAYFIFYDLEFVDEVKKKLIMTADDLLKYLPIFPAVIQGRSEVGFLFFYMFLFSLQVLFCGLIAFNFLFNENRQIDDTKSTQQNISIIKRQMSNTQKYVLKAGSFYIIVWNHLLIIPSLYFCIDILLCNNDSHGPSDDKMHHGSNIECWSSVYIILVLIGVIHLILSIFSIGSMVLFMNDSFQDSKLPWSQSTMKPFLLSVLISITYIIWQLQSLHGKLKIIPDIFCLLVSTLVLVIRVIQPSFNSRLIMKAILINEIGRFWFSLLRVVHTIFNIHLNAMSLIISVVVYIALCIIFFGIIDNRIEKIVKRGIGKIKNANELEIYLSAIYKMIVLDSKSPSIILQGILQIHIQSCTDKECPCYTYEYEDFYQANQEKEVKPKIYTQVNGSSLGDYERIELRSPKNKEKEKSEDIFIEMFRLRKASDIDNKNKRTYANEEENQQEMDSKKTFTPHVWYELIKYQIRDIIKNMKPTIESHYTLSGFYYLKMHNEFQSLFELIQAQEQKPDLHQKFLIYKHKKRIEKVIYSKHEKSSQLSRKINILSVFQYEKNFSNFQKLITKNASNCIKFWGELLEKDINVVRMHELGIQISKNHQTITNLANKLLKIYPNQLVMLINYSKYLNDVVNNEFNAFDYFNMALQQRINLKQKLKVLNNNDNEDLLFGENSFCSIFVLNTEGKKLGVIEYVNEEVQNLLGYSPQELTGKDINTIIPRMIARVHQNLLIKFFDKAESSVLNKVRELFAKDKEGYLIPIYLFSKVLPSLSSGLKLIGVIKRIQFLTFEPECPSDFNKIPQEYIICDSENNIQNFSYGLTISFGLFPKMFFSTNGNSLFDQEVTMEYLSSDFIDKEAELKSTGAIITLNTSRLFEKVDREILSNEEFNYFFERAKEVKVFCQMIEMSFSKLVTVKLYRLILFTKFQQDQKQLFDITMTRETEIEEAGLSQFNIASASVSSASSTVMSMDRQLKDFKKQMTDNIEPRIVKILRRIMQLTLLIISLLASLTFLFQIETNQQYRSDMKNAYLQSELLNKFIFTQNNLRSMLNIANKIETAYTKMPNLPYQKSPEDTVDSRYYYLNKLNTDAIEDIRILISQVDSKKFANDKVSIYEIDGQGKEYSYDMKFNLALSQYIVRSIEILNRNMTDLRMPVLDWSVNKTQQNKTIYYQNINVFVSAYFIINTGYKSLLRMIYNQTHDTIIDLSQQQSSSMQLVLLISIIAIVILLSAQIIMIIVIQIVQNNKVRVLSLYSEIKVEDANESLVKCKKFHAYLLNIQYDERDFECLEMNDAGTQQYMSDLFKPGFYEEDLDVQWQRFVERLYFLRVNNQKLNIEKLKRKLNDENNIDNAKKSGHINSQQRRDSPQSNQNSSSIIYRNNQQHRDDFQEDSIVIELDTQNHRQKGYNINEALSFGNNSRQNQALYGEDSKQEDLDSIMNKNQLIVQQRKNLNDRQRKTSQNQLPVKSQFARGIKVEENIRANLAAAKKDKLKLSSRRDLENDDNNERNSEHNSKLGSNEDSKSESREGGHHKKTHKNLSDLAEKVESETDHSRIGKHDQFSKIKSRNWRQVTFVLIQTGTLLGYFFFVIFYLSSVSSQVKDSAKHMEVSYRRQIEINQLFGYFRERLLTGKTYINNIESICSSQFYSNENDIIRYQSSHPLIVQFIYDYFEKIDSKGFCDSLDPLSYNLTNCLTFKNGILQQGYKSALFTFLNYYTQFNITRTNQNQNMSMNILNSDEIMSFLISSESYFTHMSTEMDHLWESNIDRYSETVKEILQALFIIFLLLFYFSQLIITPRIISKLNETTWRSRGILNLVPNSIFMEMKQNSRIFKLLKT
eukprot:403356802